MKKLFLATLILAGLSFSSMAQTTPTAKKAEVKKAGTTAMTSTKSPAKSAMVTPTAKVEKVTPASQAGTKLKKNGTPDKRYAANKHLKKDGTPDKRYKSNKKKS